MSKGLPNEMHIDKFNFSTGTNLAGKYEVLGKLGGGWEGEVYKVRERQTQIERTAKFFFPQRANGRKTSVTYAQRLHRLRECPSVVKYHTQEKMSFNGINITFLVSEYVEGEGLIDYLARQPKKSVSIFQGLHLLHSLAAAVESIHREGDYHGDLHPGNIIVRRYGLGFELKLLDFFHWKGAKRENMQDDLCDIIKIFYDAIGGRKRYTHHPQQVKEICCGLRKSTMIKKFKTVRGLRQHLETINWQ